MTGAGSQNRRRMACLLCVGLATVMSACGDRYDDDDAPATNPDAPATTLAPGTVGGGYGY